MNREELFQSWRRRRAARSSDVDVADRVMQSIENAQSEQARRGVLLVLLHRLAASRGGRAGLCLAALALGLLRFVYLANVAGLIAY